MRGLRTTWHLVGVPGWPNRLDVTVTADTDAPKVIKAIEAAAAANGITLQREVAEPPDPLRNPPAIPAEDLGRAKDYVRKRGWVSQDSDEEREA